MEGGAQDDVAEDTVATEVMLPGGGRELVPGPCCQCRTLQEGGNTGDGGEYAHVITACM